MAYSPCPNCKKMAYNLIILTADEWLNFECKHCGHKFRTRNEKANKAKAFNRAIQKETNGQQATKGKDKRQWLNSELLHQ